MNSLTKSLVKDLLPESIGGKEVTALFGGGFKPPTSGHLEVIQKALKNHPEIDNIIIYVGSKVRDGITQDQSFEVWDRHYKQLIDKPVRVEKSVSPIGDIYRYAKDNPEDSLYWIIGSREGREDDLQDISSRSISINKYPNLNLKTIITPDGGMSGTNARKALMNNDKEAFNVFLPSNVNQDEIWNILSSQPLDEGKIEDYFKDLKTKFDTFIEKLKTQSKDIQNAFGKLAHAVRTGETLTKNEKIEIGNQLKNTLKLAGFTAATILPGGFIYLLLSRIPALKSKLVPTSFLYEILTKQELNEKRMSIPDDVKSQIDNFLTKIESNRKEILKSKQTYLGDIKYKEAGSDIPSSAKVYAAMSGGGTIAYYDPKDTKNPTDNLIVINTGSPLVRAGISFPSLVKKVTGISVYDAIKDVLYHEIIHALDPTLNVHRKKDLEKKYTLGDPTSYYSDLGEFKAFTGQFQEKIIDRVKSIMLSSNPSPYEIEEFLQHILDYFSGKTKEIPKPIVNFLYNMSKEGIFKKLARTATTLASLVGVDSSGIVDDPTQQFNSIRLIKKYNPIEYKKFTIGLGISFVLQERFMMQKN